jgi:glyoxylase-like metal-dependent hydrolase (beta-lactamase superfamily II)
MIYRVSLGDFEVFSFAENRMHLDGGAMFGIIPKKLWSRHHTSDEANLIPLNLNVLLVKAHGKVFLADTGCGDVGTEKDRKVYGLHTPTRLDAQLKRCGVSLEDVDYVLFTHMHFDHAGGGLKRSPDGSVSTRFPNAKYVVQKLEWESATQPNARTRAAYAPEYFDAYAASGQMEVVDGEAEVCPGICVRPTGGHTRGHQGMEIGSGDRTIGFYGDMFPTTTHLRSAWVAAMDTHPMDSFDVKQDILARCVARSIWLAFDHDIHTRIAAVVEKDGHYETRALSPEAMQELTS